MNLTGWTLFFPLSPSLFRVERNPERRQTMINYKWNCKKAQQPKEMKNKARTEREGEHAEQLTPTESATPPDSLTFSWGAGEKGAFHLAMSRLNDYFRLWLIWAHRYSRCAALAARGGNPFFPLAHRPLPVGRWPNCLPNLIATNVICAGQLTTVTIGRQPIKVRPGSRLLVLALHPFFFSLFAGLQLSNQCIWLMETWLHSHRTCSYLFLAGYSRLGRRCGQHLGAKPQSHFRTFPGPASLITKTNKSVARRPFRPK